MMTVELAYLLLAGALSTLPTAPPPMVDLPYVAARMCEDVGVPGWECVATIERESGWDPLAVGDDGDALGLAQFHGDGTFGTWGYCAMRWGRFEWRPDANRTDPLASLWLMSRAAGAGYKHWWAAWPETN